MDSISPSGVEVTTSQPSGSVFVATDEEAKPCPADGIVTRSLAGRKKRVTSFLWERYLPFTGLTLLAGAPDAGKTTIAMWLVAQVSQGTLEGKLNGKPCNVLIVAPEDNVDARLIPMLDALGADLELIEEVTHVIHGGKEQEISLPTHMEHLTKKIASMREEGKDVGLIYIDSFVTSIPETVNINDYATVVRTLKAISKWAMEMRVTVLVTWHTNKSREDAKRAVDKVMGSRGFTSAARATLLADLDDDVDEPEDSVTYGVMTLNKFNAGRKDIPGLKYEIRGTEYEGYDDDDEIEIGNVGVLEWTGETESSGYIHANGRVSAENLNPIQSAIIDYLTEHNYKAKYTDLKNGIEAKLKHNVSTTAMYSARDALRLDVEQVQEKVEGKPPINYRYWVLPERFRSALAARAEPIDPTTFDPTRL